MPPGAASRTKAQTAHDEAAFSCAEGFLQGPNADLRVVLIWLEWATDGSFHFVTLKPLKRST
jgi:hypothetical protein